MALAMVLDNLDRVLELLVLLKTFIFVLINFTKGILGLNSIFVNFDEKSVK